MVRKMMIPTSPEITIKLPIEYVNHKVEILVFPIHTINKSGDKKTFNPKDFEGITHFSRMEIDNDLAALRNEWENE